MASGVNITAPPDLRTAESIARAVERRRVRRIDCVITEVWIGDVQFEGDGFPRAPAEQIRYRFRGVASTVQFELDEPLTPASRKMRRKMRIVGARPGDPCVVMLWNGTVRLHVDEELDPYGCNLQPLEQEEA